MVCVCVTKLCVKYGVCVWKRACEDGVAKDGVWQSCVWKMVWWKMVWTRTPHKDVGKNGMNMNMKKNRNTLKFRKQTHLNFNLRLPRRMHVHTQSDSRGREVPRLPRRMHVHVAECPACHSNGGSDHGAKQDPSASREPAQCHKCHACHAKWRSMSRSARPATQSDGRCRPVKRRRWPPKRVTGASPVPYKCHADACHAKWRSMSRSATPAT